MGIGDARSDRVLLVVPCHSGPGQGAEPPMEPGMGMIPDPRRIGAGMRGVGMIPDSMSACAEQLHLMGSRMPMPSFIGCHHPRKEGPKKTHRQHPASVSDADAERRRRRQCHCLRRSCVQSWHDVGGSQGIASQTPIGFYIPARVRIRILHDGR